MLLSVQGAQLTQIDGQSSNDLQKLLNFLTRLESGEHSSKALLSSRKQVGDASLLQKAVMTTFIEYVPSFTSVNMRHFVENRQLNLQVLTILIGHLLSC